MRIDGRGYIEPRAIEIITGPMEFADGSVIISTGKTKVLCSASIEEKTPPFLEGSGQGWVTAEYSMLPGSTSPRKQREKQPRGRSQEIQRLIGRSLRAGVDLSKLGARTINIDCDVMQADGGTRTASISGGYVALNMAISKLHKQGLISDRAMSTNIAATSIGIFGKDVMLDLCYEEDSSADADFNIVMAEDMTIIEIQGGAERNRFNRSMVNKVMDAAEIGITKLFQEQNKILENL